MEGKSIYTGNTVKKYKVQTTKRKCLRCQNSFNSAGNHNRLCTECNKKAQGIVEFADNTGKR